MDKRTQIVTHYAILIGVGEYPYRSLKGSERDVRDAKVHLESILQDAVKIHMITTSQTDGEVFDPAHQSALWPTYDNVISAFEETTSLARPRDFVYIHYSGHGSRKPPSGEFSNTSAGDLALVLLKGREEKGVCYLWGYELARLLKAMVDKGLVVTLVLDCCFSASVYRHDDDAGIRFLSYDAEMESEHLSDPKESLASQGPAYRDASTLPNWLINPDLYAILAACGLHEVATEPKFDGQRHGALSYFLLETIKSAGLTKGLRDIYEHVRVKFLGAGLDRQHPVFYGNQNQGFFGQANNNITTVAVPVAVTKNGTLELQAGDAQGVCDGDQFILRPFGPAKDDPQSNGSSVIFKVARTRALTSDLEPLNLLSIRVRTGWMAEPITRLTLQRFPIRLPLDFPHRDEWIPVLKARSLNVVTEKAPFEFAVVPKNSEEYKILCESGEELVNLPSMPQDQTSVGQVGDILEHLARFWLVRNLVNKALEDSFRESYNVYIQSGGKEYGPGVQLGLKHGAIAELVIKNRGEKVLYAFVYNLGPSWQVENINRGTYIIATPRNDRERFTSTKRIKLQMRVPDKLKEQGHRSCGDIVKVFISSRPTSFDLLELPRLGEPGRTVKPNRTDQVGEESENWAAMDFPIFTSL
ncbi:hypothetical protein ACEPPN_014133 [Leptodophora sp. 'Broadleaf-Isolate-01']